MRRKTTYAFIAALVSALFVTGLTYQNVNAYVQHSSSIAINAHTSAKLQNLSASYQDAMGDLRAYIITGSVLERNNDLNSQIADWVSKPFDETKLFQSLRKAIDDSSRVNPAAKLRVWAMAFERGEQ